MIAANGALTTGESESDQYKTVALAGPYDTDSLPARRTAFTKQ